MNLFPNGLFHIYNRGNNSQKNIFQWAQLRLLPKKIQNTSWRTNRCPGLLFNDKSFSFFDFNFGGFWSKRI